MNDILDLFADPTPKPEQTHSTPMNDSQRAELRALFSTLGKARASDQFAVVDELIGVRLTSVGDLTSSNASLLIHRLRERLASQSRPSTGNSWADREEETWLDRL